MNRPTIRQMIEKDLNTFKGSQEIIEQKINATSKMYFYKFKKLKEAGFNEEQALTLLCHRGLE
jgi:hypothetical protein